MKKIVILGCENSHADTFLDIIKNDTAYSDVEVLGVYSDEPDAAETLKEKFGVYVMSSYDEFAGQVDGVIITARHGANHYKYAKPYMTANIPMFIDKPITIDEGEAVEFMKKAISLGVKLTGGSSCKLDPFVQELKADAACETDGKTVGGFVRAPLECDPKYGGFFFYASHMVEIVGEIFGLYPKSVITTDNKDTKSVIFRYDNFDVSGLFVEEKYKYYVLRCSETASKGKTVPEVNWRPCFKVEFKEFYDLLCGGEMVRSYEDFIAPVFTMNAVYRSLKDGKETEVGKFSL